MIKTKKMAKINNEKGVTITIKLSTYKKLKHLNTDRKPLDSSLSDTIEWILANQKT